jgi:asparagine synthase (glutamine-hydrolysing)
MCSINGVVSLTNSRIPGEIIIRHRSIASRLSYRGPDRLGEATGDYYSLFVNQLNISCLKDNIQPVNSEDGAIILTLNGEVFNYRDLNRDLENKGYRIRNNCDHETLLRLYEEYGEKCLSKIKGMFSLAILDNHFHRFILARDRFGEKPLFYLVKDNLLHFCSEANYLVQFTDKAINKDALLQYLTLGFSLDYLIRDIKRLQPGTILVLENGTLITHSFWKPIFSIKYGRAIDAVVDEAFDILKSNIEQMIPSEVKYGSYISGGVDSSIITKILAIKSKDVDLFTSGLTGNLPYKGDVPVDKDYAYVEAGGNELYYADILAKQLGGKYHRNEFSVGDFIINLPDMISHLPGGPVISTSFPLFYFTALSSSKFRVCFTGEGSDELHGGYATSQPDLYKKGITNSFIELSDYFPLDELTLLFGGNAENQMMNLCQRLDSEIEDNFEAECHPEEELFHKIRFFMLRFIFCPHLLEKADGMTMGKAPTELRMPFLSSDYSTFALSLPFEICRHGNERKYICTKIGERLGVPESILHRAHKQRTSLPYYNLFYNNPEFQKYVQSIMNEKSLMRGCLNLKDPGKYINDISGSLNAHKRAWALLILEIWLRQVIIT